MLTKPVQAAFGALALTLLSAAAVAPRAEAQGYGRNPQGFEPRGPVAFERWSGFYLGGGLGYTAGSVGVTGSSGNFEVDQDGLNGNLFGGYNWQFGSTVAGLEADIGLGNFGSSTNGVKADVNVLGSLRGRLGVLATPQTLLYATVGLAWADYDFKATGANTVSDTLYGWTLGAGVEYMFAPQWTMRLEYNYTDLGSNRIDQGPVINKYEPEFHTVRAGIAFKF